MTQLAKSVTVHFGDCLVVLPTLAECSIDSCVTDPPYHLTSILKRFGGDNAAPAQFGKDGAYARASAGFMGKQWDGGDIAFQVETWAAIYRVLKPGAHLLAFGGTRTYHRMACAIEDVGFEIRDCIQWLYGSGFPKSHDVSKGIDRTNGFWRGRAGDPTRSGDSFGQKYERTDKGDAITDAARQWQGWGTALKPACEPIVLARKPLSEKTVAANVLRWGTGAINVDGCRVEGEKPLRETTDGTEGMFGLGSRLANGSTMQGRWPANVIHDGSDEVVAAFPESESARSEITSTPGDIYGGGAGLPSHAGIHGFNDSGSAARFFYTAKADSDDRLGSKHPTVKPLDLMQYLIRLVTPKGGTVLDPFAGTGTTGEAAFREGMHAMLIEREQEYLADMQRRMRLVMAGPDERRFTAAKARQGNRPQDAGPLFTGELWAE